MRRFGLLLLAVSMLVGSSASATTCMPPARTEEAVKERIKPVKMVILGRVEEIVCRSWLDGAEIRAENYVRVIVVEGFKGAKTGAVVELGIDKCAYASNYFEIQNTTYLIFAHALGSDGRLHTNECNFFIYETAHELTPGYNAKSKESLAMILKVLRESQ
jgi:hypothetical protein